jgi:hypothetical protein
VSHSETCLGCGFTLTIYHGRAGREYHSHACPKCSGRQWRVGRGMSRPVTEVTGASASGFRGRYITAHRGSAGSPTARPDQDPGVHGSQLEQRLGVPVGPSNALDTNFSKSVSGSGWGAR